VKTALRWVAALLASIALLFVAMNPIVSALLRSPMHGVLSGSVLLLSFREAGASAPRTIPVNYRREGDQILIGCDFDWWTQLVEPTPVALFVAGEELGGRAQVVTDENEREAGFKRLRPTTYERALASGARLVRVALD
jgi:hypothetical protein